MNRRLKKIFISILVLSLILTAVLIFFNKRKFLDATVMQVVPFLFAIIFPFFLGIIINEDRSKRDYFAKRLYDFRTELKSNSKIVSTDVSSALLEQTMFGNQIEYFIQVIDIDIIKEDLDKMEKDFKKLRDLYGNYVYDKEEILGHEREFNRLINLICDKASKAEMRLFFKEK